MRFAESMDKRTRRRSVQWAAQFLVAAELERAGYNVAFTMGQNTPLADLMVGNPNTSEQFWIDVKGVQSKTSWFGKQKQTKWKNLYYVLVYVGRRRVEDMFFVMTQKQFDGLVQKYQDAHPHQVKEGGFPWKYPADFHDKWEKTLPGWEPNAN